MHLFTKQVTESSFFTSGSINY